MELASEVNSRVPKANIRQASVGDYEQIRLLLIRHGLEPKPQEEWDPLWDENPAQKGGADQDWPRGWVLESAAGEIVGFLGNLPSQFEFQGQTLRVAVSFTWAVDLDYRSLSMFLLAKHFAQKDIDLFITTTARQVSGAAFAPFKAVRMPITSYEIALFEIGDYAEFAKSLALRKKIPLPWLVALPLSLLFRVLAFRSHGRSVTQKIQVRFLERFDSRFDDFWRELKKIQSEKLLAVRDLATLNWHYEHALRDQRAWIAVYERDGKIISYAIFYRQDNLSYRLSRMRLADFQSLESDESIARALVEAAVVRCRSMGIGMLESVGFAHEKRIHLEQVFRYSRKLEAWPYFYKAAEPGLAKKLENDKVWDPSLYDGDGSL